MKFVSGTLALNDGKGFRATTTYRLYIQCSNKKDVKTSKAFLNYLQARKVSVDKEIPKNIGSYALLDINDKGLVMSNQFNIVTNSYIKKKYMTID